MLAFALLGCGIGDNAVPMAGGGDAGEGSGGAAGDSAAAEDEDDAGPGMSTTGGGGGEGGGEESGGSSGEPFSGCGDGVIDDGEECDDGNLADGDGCESDCGLTHGVAQFALGGAHTCAVDFENRVRCFGDNSFGQLGYGTDALANVGATQTPYAFGEFVRIGELVADIALGADHSCARALDGSVYCWGRNDSGQLGYGHRDTVGEEEPPSMVGEVKLGAPAILIAAGARHTCALLATGVVRCWGDGSVGQLGFGNGFSGAVAAGDPPYETVGSAPVADMVDARIRGLYSGVGDFSCVRDHIQQLRCWGANASGQLGLGHAKQVGVNEPAAEYAALVDNAVVLAAVGEAHTCVGDGNAVVRCFGLGDAGQLGNGSTESVGDDEPPADDVVALGRPAKALAAGADFSCALLDDATVRCWGAGDRGQLGSGGTEAMGDDEVPMSAPEFGPVKLLAAATQIAAGAQHVCARTGDARLRCWGNGADGRLGYGSTENVGDSVGSVPILAVPIFQAD